MELHARVICFLRKDGALIGMKTLMKETDNTDTIN